MKEATAMSLSLEKFDGGKGDCRLHLVGREIRGR